jgi:3-phosphoshikimate 1-carboxyvinyltransferase
MAYAAVDANNVTIKVNNIKSRPYVDLTLKVMNDFGLKVPENNNYEAFCFSSKSINQIASQKITYTVESDWSGGAFLLVAGAVGGDVVVKGLDVYSTQADKKILEALKDCGCRLLVKDGEIEVGKLPLAAASLKAFQFNANDCPDLFPPLVALAAYCEGITVIEGVNRLTHKESNRALTLQDEFGKMGVEITFRDDAMLVKGVNAVKGALVHSRHDHRIAMACAVAGLKAEGETVIEEAKAIGKSYPNFFDHIASLGAKVSSSSATINA